MGVSGRNLPVISVSVLLWWLGAVPASAGTFTLFEYTYIRATGAPITVVNSFAVADPSAPYVLRVLNGGLIDEGGLLSRTVAEWRASR